ncbi:MAG: CDP-alcohol phosphatidyltransferase family protein [Lachnospiraceae bacterium]|nr:CDP-alcohol phosphatidyltransferase family protein [Lachnospiraceae bacterium]
MGEKNKNKCKAADSPPENPYEHKILTIPNLLSAFRLCLIPLFVWLYCVRQNYIGTGCVLILSGVTDVTDGYIARHFHMISNVGKVLDPIADKLTQAAMLFCLVMHFPLMVIPLALLIGKELFDGITGYLVIRKTGQVFGADWHGKAATCLIHGMILVHVIWYEIPAAVSNALIAVCIAMMAVSLFLYGSRNLKAIRGER